MPISTSTSIFFGRRPSRLLPRCWLKSSPFSSRTDSLADRPRCPRVIVAHQARVAGDVDCQDRGEAAGGGHCSGTPSFGEPTKSASARLQRRQIEMLLQPAHPLLELADDEPVSDDGGMI